MRRSALAVLAAAAALAAPAAAAVEPPQGPFRTVRAVYDLGRETLLAQSGSFRLHALPVRLAGEIFAPVGARGRRPVVVFLHGAHQSCEIVAGHLPTQDWPCRAGFVDVESFRGYAYAARRLASFGFVVLSLDGNPVAPADGGVLRFPDGAPFTPRTWMDLRAKIVDAQLRRLARASAGERGREVAFGLPLVRRLDLSRVGLVGHSRGGEGVVWASLLPGPRPYRVRALLALAPVDFFRRLLPDLPFAVVLPACDGDVFDLEGARFYDDARVLPRTAPLWQVLALGANHNFFNRVWEDELGFVPLAAGGEEPPPADPCGSDRIGETRLSRRAQEAFGAAVIVPFMRAYLAAPPAGARRLLSPLGFGGALPRDIAGVRVSVSFHPPSAERLDVVRPEGHAGLRRNLLGGRQRGERLASYGLCRYDPGTILRPGRMPGCGPALQAHALTELRVAWSRRGARVVTELPAGRGDLRGYVALTIRAGVDSSDSRRNPPGAARPFSLALRDAAGRAAAVAVSRHHPAVQSPVRGTVVLGTVRIPLAAFRGIDLGRVTAVEIRFDRTPKGRLLLTDLSFVR